jgi:hypothetical protein
MDAEGIDKVASRTNLRCPDRPEGSNHPVRDGVRGGESSEEAKIVATWLGFGPAERTRETLEVSEGGRLGMGARAGSVHIQRGGDARVRRAPLWRWSRAVALARAACASACSRPRHSDRDARPRSIITAPS